VEQDGMARTQLLVFLLSQNKTCERPCAPRHPQAGGAKLTRRSACKCERGGLERVVGVGGDNLANVSGKPAWRNCTAA
jgi:hypothetical protein